MSTMESPVAINDEATTAIRVLDQARIEIIPFGVSLTESELRTDWEREPTSFVSSPSFVSTRDSLAVGVVGTITHLNNSAVVWFGWGRLATSSPSTCPTTSNDCEPANPDVVLQSKPQRDHVVGKGLPRMGPMVVAMPRSNYQGAFSSSNPHGQAQQQQPGISSLLVGDGDDRCDDQMLASQMASRLSGKLGIPIFVSGELSSNRSLTLLMTLSGGGSGNSAGDDLLLAGLDPILVAHRAAALAERKIERILAERMAPKN